MVCNPNNRIARYYLDRNSQPIAKPTDKAKAPKGWINSSAPDMMYDEPESYGNDAKSEPIEFCDCCSLPLADIGINIFYGQVICDSCKRQAEEYVANNKIYNNLHNKSVNQGKGLNASLPDKYRWPGYVKANTPIDPPLDDDCDKSSFITFEDDLKFFRGVFAAGLVTAALFLVVGIVLLSGVIQWPEQ